MSKGCTTDYSPPRPPSIICSGLSVPVCLHSFFFHQNISEESEKKKSTVTKHEAGPKSPALDPITQIK